MSQAPGYGDVAEASRRGALQRVATDRRRRHNAVKRWLIDRALRCLGPDRHRTAHVLDLGCGRGGDLAKWLQGHPQRTYVGVDASGRAVDEARRRAQQMGVAHQCTFVVGDMVEVVRRHAAAWAHAVDVVACMFALHYCTGTSEAEVAASVLGWAKGRPGMAGPVVVMALPDHDTILGSPHVVHDAGSPKRYVYHWPPLVNHSSEQRLRVDRVVLGLKKCDPGWSLVLDVRFDAVDTVDTVHTVDTVNRAPPRCAGRSGTAETVADDRYYRGVVLWRRRDMDVGAG